MVYSEGGMHMRIYTGCSHLMEAAMIDILRRDMAGGDGDMIVVVPKQLTLQTERTLLKALGLHGSFQLQVYSPERLCGRIFDEAGAPEGERMDDRGSPADPRTGNSVRKAVRQGGFSAIPVSRSAGPEAAR